MMQRWRECGEDGFIEADVIRWTEAIWERPKGKPSKVGERVVTAEVIRRDADGWLTVLVRNCVILWENSDGRKNFSLRRHEELRRKITTIERGSPERLPWSDESVRNDLIAEMQAENRRRRVRPPKDRS